ncbi:hypothetical protein BDW59DRAFT_154928 [Aspergillus cavernicola]|uniref:NAD(P)-binding protein n=1 Tax=Aspergillus cavernicola TaxID=176166 RepID=A0ABR4HCH3_9EURO
MSDSTIVLITGVTRGIGKALLQAYLSRPNHTVIGTVRSIASPDSESLQSSPTAPGSRLLLFQLESSNANDYPNLVSKLEFSGIKHLDIVIPNAGISTTPSPLATVSIDDVTSAFEVNTVGTLRLYQAVRYLLEKSPGGKPKWVSMSSGAGSLACVEPFGTSAVSGYAMSKAAMNWITLAMHSSDKWLTAFAIHPGLVQTEMGNKGARAMGMEEAPNTIEESITKTLATIDGSTREATSGKFLNVIDGTEVPW